MKQIKYLLMAFIALFTCVSFSACSEDDEGGGGSSKNGSAFSTVDGRTVKYKYLYVVSEVANDVSYELYASTEDLFYYRQHPEKVKDNMVFSFMSLDMYGEEFNKPQHQFDVLIGYDCNLKEGITDYEDDFDSDSDFPVASTHIWYTTPWDQDGLSTETLTVKKSGKTFKVETTELTFLASEMGAEDDCIDSSSRRTKGKIAFESSNLVSAVLDSPEVVFVKSAKDRKFLKSLRARRR